MGRVQLRFTPLPDLRGSEPVRSPVGVRGGRDVAVADALGGAVVDLEGRACSLADDHERRVLASALRSTSNDATHGQRRGGGHDQ